MDEVATCCFQITRSSLLVGGEFCEESRGSNPGLLRKRGGPGGIADGDFTTLPPPRFPHTFSRPPALEPSRYPDLWGRSGARQLTLTLGVVFCAKMKEKETGTPKVRKGKKKTKKNSPGNQLVKTDQKPYVCGTLIVKKGKKT